MATMTTPSNVWEFLDTPTPCADNVRALVNWSLNYDGRKGTPFHVFLDLIGRSTEQYGGLLVSGDPSEILGYLELDYLADALRDYVARPHDVAAWLDELDNWQA